MNLLKNFLERFRHLKDPREDKLQIAQIIGAYIGTSVSIDQLEIKNNIVVLKGLSPMVRSLVYMKKEALLAQIKENLPSLFITDIR
ncbi:MAG TPA: hypothetical protein VEC13_01500 [Candidatus Paceibacterota bacterium]|nr:hypothetical protein [Candidatus Paceibacterota bacterium]